MTQPDSGRLLTTWSGKLRVSGPERRSEDRAARLSRNRRRKVVSPIACNCGGAKSAAKLSWTVDLNVPAAMGKRFSDGTTTKTYALASEANAAIQTLGLTGVLRPKPATG